LVVSGINGGLNAGINVLYSGTVAAAIEGAFFGITSIAVSLEYDEHADFDQAAEIALRIIRRLIQLKEPKSQLYNLNIPTKAIRGGGQVKTVPMGVYRYGERFEKRIDPSGRNYFWATNEPPPPAGEFETDVSALKKGFITLTPLHYDLTQRPALAEMNELDWNAE
jgi:5'-nucleotidase